MADREVEDELNEIPEIDETLESVLLYSLKDAKQKMEAGEEVVPFTALAVKENLFIETHPADDTDECFNLARHTVQGARGASAYAFCYDGYVDTDAGTKDVIIAEGGIPGDPAGYAIGYLYEMGRAKTRCPSSRASPSISALHPTSWPSCWKKRKKRRQTKSCWRKKRKRKQPKPPSPRMPNVSIRQG